MILNNKIIKYLFILLLFYEINSLTINYFI